MLVNGCELYEMAEKGNFAVGSFNFCTLTGLEAVLEAAERSNSPAFLSLAEAHFELIMPELAFEIAHYYASKSAMPIALHLDHGLSVETAVRAIGAGFTSVMFDGSSLPFEENIEETRLARRFTGNVCLEAELGELGAETGEPSAGADSENVANGESSKINPEDGFTDPAMAEQFARETKVDSLAVAIGNAHGNYKGVPKLDFERLKRIAELTGKPIVLHGGTGLSRQDFRRAINYGVRKINFFTGVTFAAWKEVRSGIEGFGKGGDPWQDVNRTAKNAMLKTTCHQMEIFKSVNTV